VALFVSLGAMLIVGLVICTLVLVAWQGSRASSLPQWLALLALGLLIGFLGWLALGVNPIAVLRGGLDAHAALAGAGSHRTYAIWVWMNVVEVAIFLGLPLTVLVVFAWGKHVRAVWQRRCSLAGLLLISSVVCLLLLTFSGVVRGETGRILLFLMPGLAAGSLAALPEERRPEIIAATLALLGAQLVIMALLMHPTVTPF
jgi:hypothetical protein